MIVQDGRYVGTVAAHDVPSALAADNPAPVSARTEAVVAVGADTPLDDVLDRLDQGAGPVPVVDPAGGVVGWVRHRDLLDPLSRPITTQ